MGAVRAPRPALEEAHLRRRSHGVRQQAQDQGPRPTLERLCDARAGLGVEVLRHTTATRAQVRSRQAQGVAPARHTAQPQEVLTRHLVRSPPRARQACTL